MFSCNRDIDYPQFPSNIYYNRTQTISIFDPDHNIRSSLHSDEKSSKKNNICSTHIYYILGLISFLCILTIIITLTSNTRGLFT
jgi:hypothetical protein